MADENAGGGGDLEMVLFVFGGFAVLVGLWFATGGPSHTDFRGIFLNAPAPINNGNAYGPQITAPAKPDTTNNQQ